MSLGFATFFVFLGLKLTDTIGWSWWWITSPLWIEGALWLGVFLGILVEIVASYKGR